MSTKTTIKRIALVAVAALSLGGVSTVAANAAARYVTPLALTAPTSPVVGTAFNVTVSGTTNSVGNTDTAVVKAYLVAKPVGSSAVLGATAGAAITNGTFAAGSTATPVVSLTLTGSGAVTDAKYTFGTVDYTATVAGSYTFRVWNDQNGDGAQGFGEDSADVTFTVAAKPGFSTIYSSALIKQDNLNGAAIGVAAPTSTTDAATVYAPAKADSVNDAVVLVTLKDTASAPMASGNTITANISGPGYLVWSTAAQAAGVCSATPTFSATTARGIVAQAADDSGELYICADGFAGTATVTISATDAAGASYALGTKKVNFYGAPAKAVASNVVSYIAAAGATASAATVTVTDSNGTPVENVSAWVAGTSSDKTVLASTAIGAASTGVAGVYTLDVNSGPTVTATSGKSATITYVVTDGTTTYATASAIKFTIGGAVSTYTAKLDTDTYVPGQALTLTVTAVDASGNVAFDGQTIGGWAANKLIPNFSAGSVTIASGTGTITGYAPATDGAFLITNGTATAKAVVSSSPGSASDAVDAANEATDAANAATDAANAAAEAADAATAAAQDAQAAVAELATQVASLIAGIKAQITTLTNLVIKIQKKVKA